MENKIKGFYLEGGEIKVFYENQTEGHWIGRVCDNYGNPYIFVEDKASEGGAVSRTFISYDEAKDIFDEVIESRARVSRNTFKACRDRHKPRDTSE